MDHSVELRTPLVDAWLLREVRPLLGSFHRFAHKRLLAEAPARPLPEALITRPKTGFAIRRAYGLNRLAAPAMPTEGVDNGRARCDGRTTDQSYEACACGAGNRPGGKRAKLLRAASMRHTGGIWRESYTRRARLVTASESTTVLEDIRARLGAEKARTVTDHEPMASELGFRYRSPIDT